MAKLYWREKVNGKWTWRAAKIEQAFATGNGKQYVVIREGEQ